MTNIFHISSTEIINQTSLQINFTHDWYQEDAPLLIEHVLKCLNSAKVIENTTGADREYTRFEWKQDYFIINFECYSQSCWIESETTPNISLLNVIKQHLIPA